MRRVGGYLRFPPSIILRFVHSFRLTSTSGKTAQRDIVQFVPFRNFQHVSTVPVLCEKNTEPYYNTMYCACNNVICI